jgi:cytochrome P450
VHDGFPFGAAATLDELAADPHPVLARLRAHEPASWVPALNGWLVTRRDLAVDVMRDASTFTVDDPRFSTARVVGPSMLSLDGEAHSRHREPFGQAFGLSRTRTHFAAFIEAETTRLVDAIAASGAAELRRGLAGPLAVAVVAEALGLPEIGVPTILSWYDAIVGSVSEVSAGHPTTAEGAAAFAQLDAGVRAALVQERPSLLMTAATRADGLSATEVVSNAAVIMFGGIETTEGMISNAVWHLLSHPAQLALVRDDPGLLPAVVDESLRLEPAAAVVDRYATRDVALGGARIQRRDLVVVSIAGANRDPAVFARPDEFDVRRANARQQLAFAHGPHVCIGMHLARAETLIALRHLLERFPRLRLDRPTAPRGLVFRKPPELHVCWD